MKNYRHRIVIPRILIQTMRITCLLFFVGILQTYALSTYAQVTHLTIKENNIALGELLKNIEAETDFYFFYNNENIDKSIKVDVNVENQTITDVLDIALKNTGISYEINNKAIVLSYKPKIEIQQTKQTIRGVVKDEQGLPVIGASLIEKGTNNGVNTDINGLFTLDVNSGSILQVSFIGYKNQEISINNQNDITIILLEDTQLLEEVVVVGYGTQKKVNLSGAVDVIDSKELSERQAATVSQMLQGVAPGFNFDVGNEGGFQPGATMNMTVRGMGSLNGGSPYVIIDGFPGDINNLNPDDIESISVLKDAASSAIYGARAPYGVIIVTTKKGNRNQKIKVNYNGNLIINTPQKLPQSLDSYTWARVQNEAGDNRGGHPISNETIDRIIAYQNEDWDYLKQSMKDWPEGATIFGAYPDGNIWNSANMNYANTDWWDIYFGHSVNQKHDISIQGGSDKISYYFSGGYMDQSSVLNFGKDDFSRVNVMGKIDVAITKWWDISYETRFAKKYREKPNMTKEGDYSFMFRHISRSYPITPVYDGWGNYTFESHIPSITAGTDRTDDYDYWNNFKMELRPLSGWKINADFAYNTSTINVKNVKKLINIHNVDNTVTPNGVSVPNNIRRRQALKNYWTTNIYSSYNLLLNKIHDFSIMAGMQLEKTKYSHIEGFKTDLLLEEVPSLQTATGTSVLYESLTHSATAGFFARLAYSFDEKYLLESNIRYDGSYVFRKDNRWGFFPSFSLGWNIHREGFWENISSYINSFKIRGSWGELGNQNVNPYSDLELIPLQTGQLGWIFDYGSKRPVGYTTAPGIVNQNLTWETATTVNIGADMSFFQNRLQATFDYFQRLTKDMIGPSEAKPGVLGANVPQANNSELRTRGWELGLRWKHALNDNFSYFINFNLYDYKSVVTKYYNPTGTLSTWYKGQEVGEIWGYTVNDLFRTQDDLENYLEKTDLTHLGSTWRTGDLRYEDINSDGKVNNGKNTIDDHGDLKKIGNDQPRWQYGITLGLNYKNLDFSMLWRGVGKKDMYFARMSNIYWGFTNGWWESCLTPDHLDYFRDEPGTKFSGLHEGDANINTNAYWPRPYLDNTEESKNKNNPNTRYLQNASYLRLQNIQIGYTLPKEWINKLNLEKIRVYFSGENLLTFTSLPNGIDPVTPIGFGEGGGGNYYGAQGSGRLTYGADRVYSFGLSITF